LEDNTVIGAIWPGHHRILYCVTCPKYTHLENEIFSWAETKYSGISLEDRTGKEEVYIWGYPEDQSRTKILKDMGFVQHTWYMYSGVIDLTSDIPESQLPEGYTVRAIQSNDLKEKVIIMSGSADLTAPNMDIYNRLMASPTYKQDLDLVIVDEKNQVVGFANIWHDTHNNIAIIEPFGTAPAHRRRGLATNLLYAIMHLL